MTDEDDLKAEIERLKAENEELKLVQKSFNKNGHGPIPPMNPGMVAALIGQMLEGRKHGD